MMDKEKLLTWEEIIAAEDEIEGGFRVGREDDVMPEKLYYDTGELRYEI